MDHQNIRGKSLHMDWVHIDCEPYSLKKKKMIVCLYVFIIHNNNYNSIAVFQFAISTEDKSCDHSSEISWNNENKLNQANQFCFEFSDIF